MARSLIRWLFMLEGQAGVTNYRVHGTDIDRAILDQAKAGGPYSVR